MRNIQYVEAVREAVREEMIRDKNVIVMGEDVTTLGGCFKAFLGLYEEFGTERVRNTPISEIAITGAAFGAALTGLRPIAEIMFSDFFGCAMDQIVNQIAKARYMFGGKMKVPMVIKSQQGGYLQNAAQHSQSLEAWFVHTPGLKVVAPSTPYDAKGLLKTAIRDDNPVIFLEHKALYGIKGEVPGEEYTLPFGVGDIKKEGNDVTIIATSFMVHKALEAANKLETEGISVEVIDPRTLVPLDTDLIVNSVKKTGRAVVVHEACKPCGIGAEIAAVLVKEAFGYLVSPIERVASKHVPIPYSSVLENACLPQTSDIITAVKSVMEY